MVPDGKKTTFEIKDKFSTHIYYETTKDYTKDINDEIKLLRLILRSLFYSGETPRTS